jgi:hypothetical protein
VSQTAGSAAFAIVAARHFRDTFSDRHWRSSISHMLRRLAVALQVAVVAYLCIFLAFVGHHSFWHSHGVLLNAVIGGLVVLALAAIGVIAWDFQSRSETK